MTLIFILTLTSTTSISNARTWSIQTIDSGGSSSLALDSNDYPYISYDSSDATLKLAKWNGSTWNMQTVDSIGPLLSSATCLVLDSKGNPCISYYDKINADLKFANWNNSTWNIQTVDSTGKVGSWGTSLILDSNDNPYISYYDETNGDLKLARMNSSTWNMQTVDSTGNVGRGSSIALDSKNYPYISYYDFTNNNLKLAKWNGSVWNKQIVDAPTQLYSDGTDTSLTLDSSGYPCIGYVASGLKFARWNGSTWNIQIVDSTRYSDGICAVFPSLALDSNDNPWISYYGIASILVGQYWDYNLNLARWNGSVWIIETVDPAHFGYDITGQWYSSLVLDSKGNPCISYYTQLVLRFAKGMGSSPTGSIVINGGNTSTNSTLVTLSLTCVAYGSNISRVRYSNDGVWDAEEWEAPSDSKAWFLTTNDGMKTVYYQIQDSEGLLSSTYLDTIILNTQIIPEFSSTLILPLFITLTLLTSTIYFKKHKRAR